MPDGDLFQNQNADDPPALHGHEAQQHGDLRQLVGNRVDGLAEIRDHVIRPRDPTVHNVRHAGQHEHAERPPDLILCIQYDDHGNERQPEKA